MRRFALALLVVPNLVACGDDAVTPSGDTSADTALPDTQVAPDTIVPGDTLVPDLSDTTVPADTFLSDTAPDTEPGPDTAPAPDTTTPPDTAPTDTSSGTASASIQALIDAAAASTAPVTVDIIVETATVTMAKPAIEAEKPGFFLQADPTGPAIFVVNEVGPNPARGDLITLRATQVALVNGVIQVIAFDGLSRGTGGNARALLQDVDAFDLVAGFDALQSEAIALDFEVVGDFGAAGAGFKSAQIVTAGNQTASDGLKVRLPTPLVTSLALSAGCSGSIKHGVFWRFRSSSGFSQSQPSVFEPGDLEIVCAGPALVTSVAASATSALLTFNKPVDAASVQTNGSQFTIAGLTVSAAVVDGRTVRLTTSSQTAGAAYSVAVAASVLDAAGRPASVPPGSGAFTGFSGISKLLINEVDYDQEGDDTAEFIEIYNPNDTAVDLSGYVVVLVNGNNAAAPALYQTPASGIALSGSIAPNGFAVVSNAGVTVPGPVAQFVVFAVNGTIQNGGNDGVQLRTTGGVVVDALLYETQATADAALLAFGEGTPFSGSDSGSGLQSVARCPVGQDTNSNTADFKISTTPSPGLPNTCP